MPIYEFECGRCGARFEELVGAGAETIACRACGATETRRVYSAPGPQPRIVKSGAATRKQERRNAELHSRAKRDFASARPRARRGGSGDS